MALEQGSYEQNGSIRYFLPYQRPLMFSQGVISTPLGPQIRGRVTKIV